MAHDTDNPSPLGNAGDLDRSNTGGGTYRGRVGGAAFHGGECENAAGDEGGLLGKCPRTVGEGVCIRRHIGGGAVLAGAEWGIWACFRNRMCVDYRHLLYQYDNKSSMQEDKLTYAIDTQHRRNSSRHRYEHTNSISGWTEPWELSENVDDVWEDMREEWHEMKKGILIRESGKNAEQ